MHIENLRMEDGRRFAMLLDDGVPVYYPSLYITTQKRDRSFETQRNILNHIRILYKWCDIEGLNLEKRFRDGSPLTSRECRGLADFCAWDAETMDRIQSGVRMLKSAYCEVGREEVSTRVAHIERYVNWLYKKITGCSDQEPALDSMLREIKDFKPKVKKFRKNDAPRISEEQLEILQRKILPEHPENPWRGGAGIRLRNLIVVYLLLETGMRRGELAALYVKDIDFVGRRVFIYRRHDNPFDSRAQQPNQKTHERTIPLSPELLALIDRYILEVRSSTGRAKKHPFLFVALRSHKGAPMSLSTANSIFKDLRKAFPELGRIHAHKLRHHWNFEFSNLIDESMKDLPEEERSQFDRTSRSYLMGWNPNGVMAEKYNRRYAEEKAFEMLEKRNAKYTPRLPEDGDAE
ncbi:tyrosine-type recombinase/integrase [Marinobacter subterrani]|uniref:tyrosine-type recombinase/integrase n=1 Tax=Marinobacter subterrani TaxID=1658765 RepID=UPI002352F8D1|nr:site-specific integrase [Marinobacter subterrani]